MADESHSLRDHLIEQGKLFASLARIITLSDVTKLTPTKVATRLEHLERLWPQCVNADLRIERCATDADRAQTDYFVDEKFAAMEDSYLDAIGEAKEYLYGPPSSLPTGSQPAQPVQHAPEASRRHTQVPQISLPRFSGAYTEWTTFHDYFTSLFINDHSFDDLQRLHYLKSCLDGEASRLIKNVTVTAANFQPAWKLLCDRFSNKRCLLNVYLNNLFALAPVTRESPADLRKLLDSAIESIDALRNLNRPVDQWDDLLVFMIVQNFDKTTRKAWEIHLGDEYPMFFDVETFLSSRIRALEAAASQPSRSSAGIAVKPAKVYGIQSHHAETSRPRCVLCSENHTLYQCMVFKTKTVSQRLDLVKSHRLCKNCLRMHRGNSCGSKHSCFHCNKRHHTMLHQSPDAVVTERRGSPLPEATTSNAVNQSESVDCTLVQSHFTSTLQPSHVVLATAWVLVSSPSHRVVKVRALLDQGSTHTFASKALAHALNAKTYQVQAMVSGIGDGATGRIERVLPISISPTDGNGLKLTTDALVLDSLTKYVPSFRFPLAHWEHLSGLTFADERPTDDTPIHLIIGADLYPYALRDGIRRGRIGEPVAQRTVFGWVLSGNTSTTISSSSANVHAHHVQAHSELDKALRQFWECEEGMTFQPPSEEDTKCETHFRETHSRQPDGRYVVRIPFKRPPPIPIGCTRSRSERVLLSLERRFTRNPLEFDQYAQFLKEYEALGHMRQVSHDHDAASQRVDLPHHHSLPLLNHVAVPRWVGLGPDIMHCELHGFSDASSVAYAAVVYLRTESYSGVVQTSLLASKTKVAPVRKSTIPRLELCGAVLLARLMSKLSSVSEFSNFSRYCWTDATIVLAWLNRQSSSWRTFVANRVAEIHTLLPEVTWRHVPGPQNPADLASRGINSSDILVNPLWWQGPSWLLTNPSEWPSNPPDLPDDAPLESTVIVHLAVTQPTLEFDVAKHFSSWPRLLRVTARLIRWSPHWRVHRAGSDSLLPSATELRLAKFRWVAL